MHPFSSWTIKWEVEPLGAPLKTEDWGEIMLIYWLCRPSPSVRIFGLEEILVLQVRFLGYQSAWLQTMRTGIWNPQAHDPCFLSWQNQSRSVLTLAFSTRGWIHFDTLHKLILFPKQRWLIRDIPAFMCWIVTKVLTVEWWSSGETLGGKEGWNCHSNRNESGKCLLLLLSF